MRNRLLILSFLFLFVPGPLWSAGKDQPAYELVLANGRVIDPESGLDDIRHVGISKGKITALSKAPLAGKEILDVRSLVVAPGFIDLHSHSQELPGARMQAFDGVTTHLELETGSLPVSLYYERLAKEDRPINYGTSSSWALARMATMNQVDPTEPGAVVKAFALKEWTQQPATPEQLAKILADVEQGLQEGGIGIGMLAGYAPGFGRKENSQVHELAVKYGVPVFSHIRYMSVLEPKSSFEAYQELIAVAAATGAHVHVCHFNSTSLRDITVCARLIADAQKRGLKITTEAYPYGAGSTGINAAFFRTPDWRERMGMDYSDIVYSKTGERLTRERMEELQKSDPAGIVILRFLDPDKRKGDQELLEQSLLFPGGAVASDGMHWQVAGETLKGDVWPLPDKATSHPRSAGTFCRFLGRYVRERKAISLLDAVGRCSLIPAQILETSTPQMKNKGRIKIGADADIIVFDAEKVLDRATFEQPAQTSVGMRHVIVNGTPVIREGELLRNARPGQPIRRQVSKQKANDTE